MQNKEWFFYLGVFFFISHLRYTSNKILCSGKTSLFDVPIICRSGGGFFGVNKNLGTFRFKANSPLIKQKTLVWLVDWSPHFMSPALTCLIHICSHAYRHCLTWGNYYEHQKIKNPTHQGFWLQKSIFFLSPPDSQLNDHLYYTLEWFYVYILLFHFENIKP